MNMLIRVVVLTNISIWALKVYLWGHKKWTVKEVKKEVKKEIEMTQIRKEMELKVMIPRENLTSRIQVENGEESEEEATNTTHPRGRRSIRRGRNLNKK
jgi:hypothetical protein